MLTCLTKASRDGGKAGRQGRLRSCKRKTGKSSQKNAVGSQTSAVSSKHREKAVGRLGGPSSTNNCEHIILLISIILHIIYYHFLVFIFMD
jgi:hypothetical protein